MSIQPAGPHKVNLCAADQCPFVKPANARDVTLCVDGILKHTGPLLTDLGNGAMAVKGSLPWSIRRVEWVSNALKRKSHVDTRLAATFSPEILCINKDECIARFPDHMPIGKHRCSGCQTDKAWTWNKRKCSYTLVCDWCALQSLVSFKHGEGDASTERRVMCKECLTSSMNMDPHEKEDILAEAEDVAHLLMHIHTSSDDLSVDMDGTDIGRAKEHLQALEHLSTFFMFWFSFLYLRSQDLIENHKFIVAETVQDLEGGTDPNNSVMQRNAKHALRALCTPKKPLDASDDVVVWALRLSADEIKTVFLGGLPICFDPKKALMDLAYWIGALLGNPELNQGTPFKIPPRNDLDVLAQQPSGLDGIYATGGEGGRTKVWAPLTKNPFHTSIRYAVEKNNAFGPIMALWLKALRNGDDARENKVVLLVPSMIEEIKERGAKQWAEERIACGLTEKCARLQAATLHMKLVEFTDVYALPKTMTVEEMMEFCCRISPPEGRAKDLECSKPKKKRGREDAAQGDS